MAKINITHLAIVGVLFQMAAAASAFAEAAYADPDPGRQIAVFSPYAAGSSSSFFPTEVDSGPFSETRPPTLPGATIPRADSPVTEAKPFSLAEAGIDLSELKLGKATIPGGDAGTRGTGDDWPYRRATVADYAASTLAVAGTLYYESEYGNPAKAKWTARNGFDESIRHALRLEDRSARDAVHALGDVLMGVMIAAPVFDPLLTLGIRDRRWDALWQTQMINLESFAFTSLVSSLMQNFIAREKPFVRNCLAGNCEAGQENRSMPSGHVAYAFTGAGLLCNHHKYQSRYGDSAGDGAVCATGIGLAALDGVVRIMADRHYATDVVVGSVIGLFSGFVLPRLLYYSWPQKTTDTEKKSNDNSLLTQVTVTPQVLNGGAGLSCDLRF